MQDTELAAWLRLLMTPGIGNSSARRLLAACGSPQAIFKQTQSALTTLVSENKARALLASPHDWLPQVNVTERWLAQRDANGAARCVITLGDAAYPSSLLDIEDPPLLLFALVGTQWSHQSPSSLAHAMCAQSLAVVGSRNPTPQGLGNARTFATEMVRSGWCVVSGLALGIDGAAHEGALTALAPGSGIIPTIAVVGTGLDRVYPRQHHQLVHDIAQAGVVLSEYPLGTPPLAANFPRRNRIIAGLSRGTLVVEAAVQSGSLITARVTAEQGKEVFAIPGSIHSTQSHGCHALIKQGAKLVESAKDIWEELPGSAIGAFQAGQTQNPTKEAMQPSSAVPDQLQSLLQALGFDPVSLDALQDRTGTNTATLQAHLLQLELVNQVARLPGGLFQRISVV